MRVIFDQALRDQIVAAVREAESRTAAEIVVVARARSGTYRDAHFAFGFAVAVATLTALFYLPTVFPYWLFPIDVVVSFAVGSLLAATIGPLGRALVPHGRLDAQVTEGAHAAFFAGGVSRTSGRWGVLVYVSVFEQRARVVADIGVDANLEQATAAIQEGARDPSRLPDGIRALGAALAQSLPRSADDRNELPDAIDAAS